MTWDNSDGVLPS